MKILQVTCAYPPYKSGIGNVARDYTVALREAGNEVDVISPATVKPLIRIGNGAIFGQLLGTIRTYDVVHLHYPFFGSALVTALACFVWRTPLVITYHMTVHLVGWRGLYVWLHHRYVEPFILRVAKSVLVSTSEYAELVQLHHAHLREFPFTVDTEVYAPVPRMAEKRCTFLFVGGMDKPHYFKGVEILLNAAARLLGDWNLVLVGSGELLSEYEKQAERLGIRERITFAGGVPETAPFYARADVHILPSINSNEAFGLVTLEAMASGIPSIVSRLPGVRTLVLPGKTGWHVAPHVVEDLRRAMQEAIDDPNARWRYGQAARARAELVYAKKDLAEKLLAVYEGIE